MRSKKNSSKKNSSKKNSSNNVIIKLMNELKQCTKKHCDNTSTKKEVKVIMDEMSKIEKECLKQNNKTKTKIGECIKDKNKKSKKVNRFKTVIMKGYKCIETKCKHILSNKEFRDYKKEMDRIINKCFKSNNGIDFLWCSLKEQSKSKILKKYRYHKF